MKGVLSTMNEDGSRRRLRPRLAKGRFLRRRQIVGYALVALFVALPFAKIGGRPALLMDLTTRELSLFGAVFRPSDGFLLMLLGLTVALTVFLVTALFGRVWCGWGCPQTVYLELVFRPIERWLEGTQGKRPRRILKWTLYTIICFLLANVFLAYFVGVARLEQWVVRSPGEHVGGFMLVVGTTALMMFDFAYFREQMCTLACPYGRLQTVLLDRSSLIIGYDVPRGEPRSRLKKKLPVIPSGDCVDCSACVTVCPTGIDIRDGLQMECIGCAQCIDACDAVMDKLERPRGLIGYTSSGPRRLLRARTVIYPALLAIVAGLLVWGASTRAGTKVVIDRINGPAFVQLADGSISSQARLKIENETDSARTYTLTLVGEGVLRSAATVEVKARKSIELPIFIDAPAESFTRGKRTARVRITDGGDFTATLDLTLFGPEGGTR